MLAQIETDVRAWDAILDHRTGSAGDRLTADWLAAALRAAGVEPELSGFDFTRREPGSCEVSIRDKTINGVPLFDGPPGEFSVPGHIGALGGNTEIGLIEFAPSPQHPGTQALAAARAAPTPHAAIVAVSAAEGIIPGLAVLNAERYGQPFGPPVLQVSSADGERLLSAARNAERVTVRVTQHEVPARAINVCARLPGRNNSLAPLVVMTPRSAWWTCTAERMGGIAVWLAIIRQLAGRPPERPVIFAATTGHELNHLGLDHFLAAHPGLASNAQIWIHLGANFAARDSRLRWQASSQTLLDRGPEVLGAAVDPSQIDVTPLNSKPFGEARNIYAEGGTFVSVLGSNHWFHHPADRWPESVDLSRTAHIAEQLVRLADELAAA